MQTAAAAAQPLRQDTTTLRAIDCRWLLALYAIVPAALLVVVADQTLFDRELLRGYLPRDPEAWPFWTVVFGLPHIVASLLTMADREYIGHYRRILLWPLIGFAALTTMGMFGPQPVSKQLLFVVVAFYTIYHVLSQQLGITMMMMGLPPSPTFKAWRWCAIFAGFVIYTLVFGQPYGLTRLRLGPVSMYELLEVVAAGLVIATAALAIRLTGMSRHRVGTWYLWANVALILCAFLTLELRYTAFTIIMPRVIHDLTAFTVYITHDSNRNGDRPRNVLYQLTRFTRLPPLLVLPAASIGIAYAMTSSSEIMAVNIAIITISFLHYYYEGFIWRGPNPHRQQVAFRR